MKCQKCSKDIPEDSGFCPFCGAEVIAVPSSMFCKSCGNSIPADSEFCPFCGKNTLVSTTTVKTSSEAETVVPDKRKRIKNLAIVTLCLIVLIAAGIGIRTILIETRVHDENPVAQGENEYDEDPEIYSVAYVLQHRRDFEQKTFFVEGWILNQSENDSVIRLYNSEDEAKTDQNAEEDNLQYIVVREVGEYEQELCTGDRIVVRGRCVWDMAYKDGVRIRADAILR